MIQSGSRIVYDASGVTVVLEYVLSNNATFDASTTLPAQSTDADTLESVAAPLVQSQVTTQLAANTPAS
jgi:hypothetical protein